MKRPQLFGIFPFNCGFLLLNLEPILFLGVVLSRFGQKKLENTPERTKNICKKWLLLKQKDV